MSKWIPYVMTCRNDPTVIRYIGTKEGQVREVFVHERLVSRRVTPWDQLRGVFSMPTALASQETP